MVTSSSRPATSCSVWSEMVKSWLEVVSIWVMESGRAPTRTLAATAMASTMAAAATLYPPTRKERVRTEAPRSKGLRGGRGCFCPLSREEKGSFIRSTSVSPWTGR